jgi:anti-sigma B factor antagonist
MSRLDIEKVDGVPIAHVNEDIDAANVAATHRQLAEALGPDALGLVIELSDVRYLDSAGLDMLLRLSDRLNRRRAKLFLVIPEDSQLKRLVSLVGLPDVVAVHPSLSAALEDAAKARADAAKAQEAREDAKKAQDAADDAPCLDSNGVS